MESSETHIFVPGTDRAVPISSAEGQKSYARAFEDKAEKSRTENRDALPEGLKSIADALIKPLSDSKELILKRLRELDIRLVDPGRVPADNAEAYIKQRKTAIEQEAQGKLEELGRVNETLRIIMQGIRDTQEGKSVSPEFRNYILLQEEQAAKAVAQGSDDQRLKLKAMADLLSKIGRENLPPTLDDPDLQ